MLQLIQPQECELLETDQQAIQESFSRNGQVYFFLQESSFVLTALALFIFREEHRFNIASGCFNTR